MSENVCPLVFRPIFRAKTWGGRNLERLLGKSLPAGESIGESWECADLPEGQSIVAVGPAAGRTLEQVVAEWGADLLGRAVVTDGRFPLLIKFLDACQPLSIQVHPDAETARRLGGGARPKEEMFYIVAAEPHGCVYLGVRPGVSLDELRSAAQSGEVEALMNRVPVRAGQAFHVPPGTLHALGAGVVAAEVETPSDTTYRLFDWNRRRPAGDAGLHIDAALASIRLDDRPPEPPPRQHVAGLFTAVSTLVECPAFKVEKVRFIEGMEMEIPYAELVVWVVLEGRGAVLHGRGGRQPFMRGDVVVLPAALPSARLKTETDCVWLEVTIPVPSDLAEFRRPSAAELRDQPRDSGGAVQLGVSIRRATPEC